MTTVTLSRLTFGGILRSEFIKLRTLRSTIWLYSIIVFVTVALGFLYAASSSQQSDTGGSVTGDVAASAATSAATISVNFSELVVAVLGALIISGEYGTGMIRTTFTTVPKRLPALYGKALMFAITTFVVTLVATALTAVASAPLLAAHGTIVDFGNAGYLLAILGSCLYTTLIGLFAYALGAIIRNSAGGIAAALGAILVLPTIIVIFATLLQAAWLQNVYAFLPSIAGSHLYDYVPAGAQESASEGVVLLNAWQGGLVLLAWVVVLMAVASALVKRRDV